jgi:hypothetical protein
MRSTLVAIMVLLGLAAAPMLAATPPAFVKETILAPDATATVAAPGTQATQSKLPIVKASKLVAEFEDDYRAASAKYRARKCVIQGKVESTNVVKNGENTFIFINMTAKANPIDAATAIEFACEKTMIGDVGKLKKGDEVEVTVTGFRSGGEIRHQLSSFYASAVKIASGDAASSPAKTKIMDWVLKNSSFQAPTLDTPMVKDMGLQVDKFLADDNNFTFALSADLMKSKKDTLLSYHNGRLFNLELTDAQSSLLKLPKGSMSASKGNQTEEIEYAEYQIKELSLGGGTWVMSKELKGAVTLKEIAPLRDPNAYYALRLMYYRGKVRDIYYFNIMVSIKDTPIAVSYPASSEASAISKLGNDPALQEVFVDVVRKDGRKFTVVSEAYPVIMTLKAK